METVLSWPLTDNMLCFFCRKMSWDSYIDNLIGHSKTGDGNAHVDKAGIFSIDGGAPWTTAHGGIGFVPQGSEMSTIASCLKSKSYDALYASGIKLEGQKYQFLRVEDDKILLGKMKGFGAVTCQATKTAIVAAHCKEGCQHGIANKAVAVIAEYLESLGM